MKKVELNLNNFSLENIKKISSALKRGEVLVLPTDTIYGLSCLATNKKATQKIYDIKGRNKNKPLVVLMKSFCMLRNYCYLSQKQYTFLKRELNSSRPVTVILKSRNKLQKYSLGEGESIAVRIPVKSDFLIKVLRSVNEPLASTSLNVSGEKELNSVENIGKYFKDAKPDVLVDAGKISSKPSRIIDIRDMDNIRVLRR